MVSASAMFGNRFGGAAEVDGVDRFLAERRVGAVVFPPPTRHRSRR
jgi:hypothetical protein